MEEDQKSTAGKPDGLQSVLSFPRSIGALGACFGLCALGRLMTPVAVLALVGQLALSTHGVRRWERHYPGVEWASELFKESDERGLAVAAPRLKPKTKTWSPSM